MMYSYTCTLVLCRSRASRASRSNDRSWQPGIAIELLDLRNQRLNQLLDLIHSWARADVGIAAVPTWRWASSSNQQCWWSRCVDGQGVSANQRNEKRWKAIDPAAGKSTSWGSKKTPVILAIKFIIKQYKARTLFFSPGYRSIRQTPAFQRKPLFWEARCKQNLGIPMLRTSCGGSKRIPPCKSTANASSNAGWLVRWKAAWHTCFSKPGTLKHPKTLFQIPYDYLT